jgi:hypothetical protein
MLSRDASTLQAIMAQERAQVDQTSGTTDVELEKLFETDYLELDRAFNEAYNRALTSLLSSILQNALDATKDEILRYAQASLCLPLIYFINRFLQPYLFARGEQKIQAQYTKVRSIQAAAQETSGHPPIQSIRPTC